MSNERLTTLEMNLSHMEQQFEDINEVVLQQAKAITLLNSKLKIATDKIVRMQEDTQEAAEDSLSPLDLAAQDKPPHY